MKLWNRIKRAVAPPPLLLIGQLYLWSSPVSRCRRKADFNCAYANRSLSWISCVITWSKSAGSVDSIGATERRRYRFHRYYQRGVLRLDGFRRVCGPWARAPIQLCYQSMNRTLEFSSANDLLVKIAVCRLQKLKDSLRLR